MSASQDYYQPTLDTDERLQSVLIITDNEMHDLEFFYPYYRFCEEGYHVDVATPKGGEVKGEFGMKLSETKSTADVDAADYSMLYIPGGKAPETLRKDQNALDIVRDFVNADKPIAAICHGAQVLVSADVVKNRRLAAWPEVRGEIEKSGGTFVNEPLVEDGIFITGRWPGDLPGHMARALEILATSERPARQPKSALS